MGDAEGHYEVAKVLLEHGADPNLRGGDGTTPLIQAASTNNRGLTKLLLERGASCNGTSTVTGGTALHAAVKAGATKAIQVLLDNHAYIDLHDRDGYAPLHEAANKPVIAELLLDQGANPKIQNSHNHLQPLHMAARHGSLAVCRLLLSAGADVTAASKDLSTPLHEAGEAAQTEVIQLLVAHGASCLVEDKHHMTPLSTALRKSFASAAPDAEDKLVESVTVLLSHGNSTRGKGQVWPELEEAALGGHAGVVQLLLDKGAAASDAALTVASQTGHLEVVKLLLRHRSSARQPSGDEPNALHMVARVGHAEVAQLLLENGADAAATCTPPQNDRLWTGSAGKQGLTALQIALDQGHAGTGEVILKAAVKAGADVSSNAPETIAMLHNSASKGDKSIMRLLLDKVGVDPNSQHGREQLAAMHAAAKAGHQGCLELLLEAGADINQQTKRGHTPLFLAVNGGHFFAVQFLLRKGADPAVRASDTRTALFAAAAVTHHSSLSVFDCLLDTAADKQERKDMVSAKTRDGRTVLHLACASSNVDVVKRLLEEGAAVNVQSEDGATPLARAAACGNIKIINMLEAAGGRVDMRNASGMTPLAYSAAQGNVKALETLIAKGANLHTRNQDGTTPLHQAATCGNQDKNAYMPHHDAASRGQLRALTALLRHKRTPVNDGVHEGLTALHLAASEDNHEVIEVLLAHAAHVDKRSYVDGRTALHYAASWGNVHAVRSLLAGGASIRALDNTGRTALHWAAYAPIKPLDDFLKEQAISEGASEQSLVLNHGIVQVLYELLRHDPKGAELCDDKGHLPLELAVDRSYDHPSPVMDVVVQMLTNPDKVGQLFSNKWRQDPQLESRDIEADSGGSQGWEYEDEDESEVYDEEEEEEDEITAEARAAAEAAAEEAAQQLLQQEAAERREAEEKAAKAALKRAAKKKRQKASKKGAAQSADQEAEDGDPSQQSLPPPDQYMAALASLLYPGATAAAGVASQYPLGVPLPGQGTPAAAAAQQQAATQHGLGGPPHYLEGAMQAPDAGAGMSQRQGKKRGGKKQAQKIVIPSLPGSAHNSSALDLSCTHLSKALMVQAAEAAARQLQPPAAPAAAPPAAPYNPLFQPRPVPQGMLYQPHLHEAHLQQHYAQPNPQPPVQPVTQRQGHSHGRTAQRQYDYQPAHLQQPEPVLGPYPASPPASQPQSTRGLPPGYGSGSASQYLPAGSHSGDPYAQNEQFPPLHQAATTKAGGKKKQGKAPVRQPPQQQQQQQSSELNNNWMAGFPDMQALQQQQQQQMHMPQHSLPAGSDQTMLAQMARRVEQLEQQFAVQNQQQASVVDGATSEGWPGMTFPRPHAAVPAGPSAPAVYSQAAGRVAMASGSFQQQLELRAPRRLVKGLPESDLQSFTCPITHAVMWDPVVASDGYTYERAAIEEWLLRRPEGQALSPMTQVPMTRMVMPNIAVANLIRSKEAK
ncbi:Ankyrin repeat and SOCS box protein 16 [Trebouxia sp. C0009 RCD-2024]